MKTLHLHRPAPPPRAHAPHADGRPSHLRPSIVRLGVAVSLVAAALAVVLDAVADVPAAVILVPVVVVGFALSWHASGQPDERAAARRGDAPH